jgi:hypothetical protein
LRSAASILFSDTTGQSNFTELYWSLDFTLSLLLDGTDGDFTLLTDGPPIKDAAGPVCPLGGHLLVVGLRRAA